MWRDLEFGHQHVHIVCSPIRFVLIECFANGAIVANRNGASLTELVIVANMVGDTVVEGRRTHIIDASITLVSFG